MSARAAAAKGESHTLTQTKRPFSPKKLRSKPVHQFVTESEDELAGYEQEDIIEIIPALSPIDNIIFSYSRSTLDRARQSKL
jgi:chromodomain-helicase-DNA-binding protein 4